MIGLTWKCIAPGAHQAVRYSIYSIESGSPCVPLTEKLQLNIDKCHYIEFSMLCSHSIGCIYTINSNIIKPVT